MTTSQLVQLTHAEKRIFLTQELNPKSHMWTIHDTLRLVMIDLGLLKKAIEIVIEKSVGFNIVFTKRDSEIYKYYRKTHKPKIECIDFTNTNEEDYYKWAEKDAAQVLPIVDELLYTIKIVTLGHDVHHLIIKYHHIFGDGTTLDIINNRILTTYDSLQKDSNSIITFPEPPSLDTSYRLEQEYLQSNKCGEDKEYWQNLFSTIPEPMNISGKTPTNSLKQGRIKRKISKKVSKKLLAYCAHNKVSPFRVVTAAIAIIFSRTLMREDVVIGLGVANRLHKDLYNSLGMFVNNCSMRLDIEPDRSFEEVVQLASSSVRNGLKHGAYPYDKFITDLRERTGENHTLNDCTLVEGVESDFPSYADRQVYISRESLSPIVGYITFPRRGQINKKDITLEFLYNSELFEEWRVSDLIEHIENLLDNCLDLPTVQVSKIDFLSGEKRQLILEDFNKTDCTWETEVCIHERIEKITNKYPGKVAIVYRGKIMTYRELDLKSNALARTLLEMGTESEDVIGILAETSIDIIVAQLAILKAGAAFMPIDTKYPNSRIQYMLEDINAPIVISQSHLNKDYDLGKAIIINLDDKNIYNSNDGYIELSSRVKPTNLCAVFYTSGSTGNPKGVLLEHRSICNTINAAIYRFQITTKDKFAKQVSFSFDPSMLEIFSTLMSGAELHMIPEEIKLSLGALNEYYEYHGISIAVFTTRLAEQFAKYFDNKSLRYLFTGGEKLIEFTPRSYTLVNSYGPTECSIQSTSYNVLEAKNNIPIGYPLNNNRIYLIDKYNNPQPVGYGGELCIAGIPLARGYHNLPEKTSEHFKSSYFREGERLYKTGDLACWAPDGAIFYMGRIDRQIKIRGFRVELGEIETAMLDIDGINTATVVDYKDSHGNVYLCGYFTGGCETEKIINCLKVKLPPFMVPAHLVGIDELPLNNNGKVDRNKLPKPKEIALDKDVYISPKSETEKSLCDAWGKVLELERVSVDADFFKIGGDSLRTVALQLTLFQDYGIDIELPSIFEYSTPQKLAKLIEQNDVAECIPTALKSEFYPTTISQQQLYLLSQMEGIGITYNMPLCFNLTGELDSKKLSDALVQLVDRHESLRTSFQIQNGRCVQKIITGAHLKLEYAQTKRDDITGLARDFIRPFNLANAPLMRAKLIEHVDGMKQWLLLDFHHIAFDGVSLAIFMRELFALYKGENLQSIAIQHKDFATWEEARLEDIIAKHEIFWHDLFTNPPEIECPTDYRRPKQQEFIGDSYKYLIDDKLTKDIYHLAQFHGATLHQTLISALGCLISRWSDSEDVCIGTSMSGRNKAETAAIIGMFVRTLPTRIRPEDDKTFSELLEETRQQMCSIQEHSEYPISSLYEFLGANRGAGRHPLFDINFVMRSTGINTDLASDKLTLGIDNIALGIAKFDISISAEETEEGILLDIDYRTSLYKRKTIINIAEGFGRLLRSIAANPKQALGEIDLQSEEERDVVLKKFNPAFSPQPKYKNVCEAISHHANTQPNNTAVIGVDGSLSYLELENKASRIASAIVANGGGKDSIIAVVAERSIYTVVGMLATLKAGCAYVGLDNSYPQERIDLILEETMSPCVVGSKSQLDEIEFTCPAIIVDEDSTYSPLDSAVNIDGDALAYCIFTSGSTGKPKGVLIEHHSMVNFINWYSNHHQMKPESNCAAFASFSFDVSVVQVFAPLYAGSTLHVLSEDIRKSPHDLEDYFRKHDVSHAHFPTQFAEQYMRLCEIKSLKHMVVGGDSLKSYSLGNFKLANEYGPSETAMACLSYDVRSVMEKPPIGVPVDNVRIYILDSKDRLRPVGVAGEICVAGSGVGRGYLNNQELTDKYFVEDPFYPGERMFRTGDKGCWLENGTVDFIGRIDFQIKIRGYRIEPGEIETCIKKINIITDCVVVAFDEPSGNKALIAYYTASGEVNKEDIELAITDSLPQYMVPAYIIQLEKLPLNNNGKIDRGKLPAPEFANNNDIEEITNVKELDIAKAWQDVLGHNNFGRLDSFYDIGGDSLSVLALLASLSDAYDISATDLFTHTTVAEQAFNFKEAELTRSNRLLKLKDLVKEPAKDPGFETQVAKYEGLCRADEKLDTETVRSLSHVLITGATGTLGIYLLRELLEESTAKVTAIVRGKDDLGASQRLSEHYYDRFGQDLLEIGENRIEILAGDLAKTEFQLDKKVYDKLEHSVDTILHSAALTSHYGDWDVFVAANITSTENLAAFAQKGRKKTIHHVSTTSVGGGQIEGKTQNLFTEFDIDLGQESGNNYIKTKLLAEKCLDDLRASGLSSIIYRAGNITCDSKTGVFQRNVDDNAFYQQLRAYINLGVAPDKTDVRNMSYVDQAAKAIVMAMHRPGLLGQNLHIHNDNLLSISESLSSDDLGLNVTRIAFDEFIDFLAEMAGLEGFEEYIDRILLHLGWQDWLANPGKTATKIEVTRSAKLLARCGFSWKKPESADLRFFVEQALKDRVETLMELPVISSLENDTLLDLAKKIIPSGYKPDVLIQQEEMPSKALHLIISGMAETYRRNRNGWVGTVRLNSKGSLVGEEAVFEDSNAGNSVAAIDNVFAYSFKLTDFRDIVAKHPRLGLALLKLSNIKTDQGERLFVVM
ncbi:MAG: amino acid adenylation domain-containing protein [Desulfotalea sp.]